MLQFGMNYLNTILPLNKPQEYLKGFLLTFILFVGAYALSIYIPLGAVSIAIILGILISNTFNISDSYNKGIKYSSTIILSFSIALMGVNLNVNVLSQLGISVVLLIVFTTSIAIILSVLLSSYFGLSKKLALLLGCGNAICGSAAISAVSPVIDAKKEDTATSIAIVNLLGVIALFVFPAMILGHPFSDTQISNIDASVLIGNTFQAVGQASGAGFSINDEVGVTSTTVKMGRVLMLTPVLLVIALAFGYLATKKNNTTTKPKLSSMIKIPVFIVFFVIFSAISSLELLPAKTIDLISDISSYSLVFAMSALALGIHFSHIKENGIKALKLASFVFGIQIIITISWIVFF